MERSKHRCNHNCSKKKVCKLKANKIKSDEIQTNILDVKNELNVKGNANVGELCVGADVPVVVPESGSIRNGEKLFVNVFPTQEENPYFSNNSPYNFITQIIPEQTYRNASSVSMDNTSVYFNPTKTSNFGAKHFEFQSTEIWKIPVVFIAPLTKENPDITYLRNGVPKTNSTLIPANNANNFSGQNLYTAQLYSADGPIQLTPTVNSGCVDGLIKWTNDVFRAKNTTIKYLPDSRSSSQLEAAKLKGLTNFNDFDVREMIADTGLELQIPAQPLTWNITTDPTDQYRIYATSTLGSDGFAKWPVPASSLPNEANITVSLDSLVAQNLLNKDFNESEHTLTATNGVANAEFRIQYRSHVPSIFGVTVASGSVNSLVITEPGKGYTSIPILDSNYPRKIIGGTTLEDSKSGFDDASIEVIGSGGGAPLSTNPADVIIHHQGSGYTVPDNTILEVEFFDAFDNIYGAYFGNAPKGTAKIVGGKVVEVLVTEPSTYLYPPVWGRVIGGRNRANIAITINPNSSLSYNLVNGGSGYTSVPIYKFEGGTTMEFARASATVSGGKVVSANVTSAGKGYIASEYTSVVIVDKNGTGSGATATATVLNSGVASITITNQGSNYSNDVAIYINGGRPWIYSSRLIDFSFTNLASMLYQLAKYPNGFTTFMTNSTSYAEWSQSPLNPDGTFNPNAQLLNPGGDWSYGWSWLPKLYEFKKDYPQKSLEDYFAEKDTYTPVRNAGDYYMPLNGSFDTTRWALDLSGAYQITVGGLFSSGSIRRWFNVNTQQYEQTAAENFIATSTSSSTFHAYKRLEHMMTKGLNFNVFRSTNFSTVIAHEFGHTAGLGHTESGDQAFSTGVGVDDDFGASDVHLNYRNANIFMRRLIPGFYLTREDGSIQQAAHFNIMSYEPYVAMFTKEQRLIMRYFMARERPTLISSIVSGGLSNVNTSYLDLYLDNVAKQTIVDLDSKKIRTSAIISDSHQTRKMEADYAVVNGEVQSQISKAELGIFDYIVLGNNQKKIYVDDQNRLIMGDIMIYNDNGCIKFAPVPSAAFTSNSSAKEVTLSKSASDVVSIPHHHPLEYRIENPNIEQN